MNYFKEFTFDRVVRLLISIGIIALIGYFIKLTSSALVPFAMAWLIAYLLHPVVKWMQLKLRLKNSVLAVIITLILLFSSLGLIILGFVPLVGAQFNKFVPYINDIFNDKSLTDFIPAPFIERVREYLNGSDFMSLLTSTSSSDVAQKIVSLLSDLVSSSFSLLMLVITIFAVCLYLVFILKDYEKLADGAVELIPPTYKERVMMVIQDVQDGMSRYFRGQATVALFVGLLLAVGFQIIGLPLGIVLGLVIGLLNLVPYLQIVGLIPMAMMSLLQSIEGGESFWWCFMLSVVVLMVVQTIQDLFLVPRIMGKASGLHPAVILLSLSIWGVLLGVLGMIIALPMTSILLSYYQRFILKKPLVNREDF